MPEEAAKGDQGLLEGGRLLHHGFDVMTDVFAVVLLLLVKPQSYVPLVLIGNATAQVLGQKHLKFD